MISFNILDMKRFLTLSAASGLRIEIKRPRCFFEASQRRWESLNIQLQSLNMNAWFTAPVFTGHSKQIQQELFSPEHPASWLCLETASPKVALWNQMGSLFGFTPSSDDKHSFSHLFSVARDNEACFESQHFKGLIITENRISPALFKHSEHRNHVLWCLIVHHVPSSSKLRLLKIHNKQLLQHTELSDSLCNKTKIYTQQ